MTITAADNYYGVICNSSMEHCHCDFRLNIYDCIEASIFRGINIGKIGLCAVNVVLGASILGYRCGFRGYRIWDLRDLGLRGILRPRPVECMILFATSFNFLRLLNAGFLLAGYSGTYIVRAFLFELPWQLGFSALAIYLMGVTTTLSGSHKIKKETWLPHAELLDYVVAFFLFSPFITNNACAILAGYFADTGNKIGFDITTRMLYVLWSVYCFTLDVVVWLFGMRLIRVLKEHLAEFREDNSPRYRVLSFNMTKLRIVLVATFICLFSFIVVLLSYSIWRTAITTNTIASTIWAVLWEYVGSISTFLILCALAMSPVQPKGSSQSNSSKPTNNPGSSTNAMTTESSQFSSMQNDSNTTGISCAGRDDLYIPMRNIDTLGMKPNSADYVRRSGPDGISSDLGMAQYQYYQQKHGMRSPPLNELHVSPKHVPYGSSTTKARVPATTMLPSTPSYDLSRKGSHSSSHSKHSQAASFMPSTPQMAQRRIPISYVGRHQRTVSNNDSISPLNNPSMEDLDMGVQHMEPRPGYF